MFYKLVLVRYHIFWEIGHFWEFQIKEINWENKGKKALAKEKVKGLFEKTQLKKQLDTIVDPQNKHTIVDHDHSCFFGWLKLILWKPFGFDSKKNEAK